MKKLFTNSKIRKFSYEFLKSKGLVNNIALSIAILTSIQPGSTFKMITALAALEKGVDPLTEIFCPGTIKVGERNFSCWTYTLYGYGHGWQNMYEAIQNSCKCIFLCNNVRSKSCDRAKTYSKSRR